ncbi:copper amine oxidase N-terminal domain-containing protein [Anoxynatronum buryatiense]|uniref:Copper amine oxidase N-terminal domain-containing protein n=1 Tax=Anoxynatronum buryatiense TaxID=489973 RepID=A0AA45WUT8_9CLOT|nr:copper amine oxidase N-terminal domain-containing protein [Anoxynatronum buryatiense]SMP48798.1 Copper amine oxidase N-terminal domain-containing protein [Anoxynatronum buryatiense]
MRSKWLLFILITLLVSFLLSGCIDDSLISEEYYEDFEDKMGLLQVRVEDFSRLMTEEERNQFEQRVELEIFRFSMALFDDLERLTDAADEPESEAIEELLNAYLIELEEIIDELELTYAPAVSTVRLIIGESRAWVDQAELGLDQPPTISETGRTLVPLRFVAEALSAEVNWNETERKITYTKGPQEIVLHLNEATAMVNGSRVDLGVPPVIINGRTLVPLRFISETMGFLVDWQEEIQQVTVTGRLDGQIPSEFKPMEIAMDVDEYEEDIVLASSLLGVIVDAGWEDTLPYIVLLVDGETERFEATSDLLETVIDEWDHYSHWGLYEAEFDEFDRVVTLEYGEGVADIIGIFADFYTEKTLADVLDSDGNHIMLISVDNLLNSDDPEDLPGFSTIINNQLTPADGDIIILSENVVVYVEGDDGIFVTGNVDMIDDHLYDYVELYDIDGDLIYDIVVIWLI